MELKDYQQNALEQLNRWTKALNEAIKDREKAKEFYNKLNKSVPDALTNYPSTAWENLRKQGVLPVVKQGSETEVLNTFHALPPTASRSRMSV